ncbi:MAG: lactonase family protein, partial [Verrucomicrobiota bacterium]
MLVYLVFFASSLLIHAESVNVYFGTRGHSAEGIYRAELDKRSGKLSSIQLAVEARIPAFLALHPAKEILYAITGDRENAAVASFTIEEDGGLTQLNEVKGVDGRSAHIAVHPSGLFLMTAQYGGGSVALYPLKKDGSLEPCKQKVEHEGASGVVKNRQRGPHPHWVGFSPDARFAFVPDLGLDQIIIYRVNTSELTLEKAGFAQSVPGGGPRHMRFSVDGEFIYLLNELELSVTTFAYESPTGSTKQLTTTRALSEEQKAKESFNSASEILVHPNGLFVYTGNRGHDSV